MFQQANFPFEIEYSEAKQKWKKKKTKMFS